MFQPIGHGTWCFKTVFKSYSLLHSFNTYLANAHYMPSTELLCFSLKAPSQATKVFFPEFWRHLQNYWHQWQPWRGRQLVSSFHYSLRLSVTSVSHFLTSSPLSSKQQDAGVPAHLVPREQLVVVISLREFIKTVWDFSKTNTCCHYSRLNLYACLMLTSPEKS